MDLRSPRVRVVLLAALAGFWLLVVLGKLGWVQLVRYQDFRARAQRQQQRIIEITPKRGVIYDRNGRELAMSVQVESAFAVPAEIAQPHLAARLLSGVLRASAEEIETRLKSSRSFVWLARKLSAEQVEQIRALNLKGVYFQKENRRFYPKRTLAAHVLGYVDIDEKGLGGIEYALDSQVRGRPGRMLILADARRRWYDRNERQAEPGASVVLTLDEKIQYIAERELARAIGETRAEAGTIIVQDPYTGELLALANWPTFNPNAPGEAGAERRTNRAVSFVYEPGSTFKIVTLAAALEERLTRPQEVIDCQQGAIYIAGHRIRDHKPFGLLSVSDVMAQSSDVGAIKLGLRLGAPKFYDYIRRFGFGQLTGIELAGESRGLLRRVEGWTPVSVGSISMGQEIGVTSVQLVSAMSAVANGGVLLPPRVVRELRRDGRSLPPEPSPAARIISATTAATLRAMLAGVVLDGTGKLARLEGYTAAGKTGTAQKIDPSTGRYSLTDHIASFVGFAPLNEPAVTVLVMLDSPPGNYHGGSVAAPVFRRVAEQVLAYLDIPHDVALPTELQRAAARRARPDAAELSDFSPLQRVSVEVAAPAEPLPPSGEADAAVTLALAGTESVVVPDLRGRPVRSVIEECLKLGLNPVVIGTGIATEQQPPAGERVVRGGRITVRFGRASTAAAPAGERGN
jgi:cell division protein FtsI (penicillin-binding protein 3)